MEFQGKRGRPAKRYAKLASVGICCYLPIMGGRHLIYAPLFLIAACGLFDGPGSMVTAADAALVDGGGDGGPTVISGILCALADLRLLGGCQKLQRSRIEITIDETKQMVVSDDSGRFSFTLPDARSNITLLVNDPTRVYLPSVLPLGVATLRTFAVPLVAQETVRNAAFSNGFSIDPRLGVALAYVVDPLGQPAVGVTGEALSGSIGPLYDGAMENQLAGFGGTRAFGLVSWFELPAIETTVTLHTPDGSRLVGDKFKLPVRKGSITVSLLPLATRH